MTTSADAPVTATVTANFSLKWQGRRLEAHVPVPTGPVRPRVLLPLVHSLTNALVELGESVVRDAGETVSCRAGCGACCRQLVPVSETEAHAIRDLVEALPEPRRTAVRERFADARRRLAEGGLLPILHDPGAVTDKRVLGRDYFHLGVPCPFLEEESCSIHPDRPISCREYLVTSPAEQCRNPSAEGVCMVPTPGRVMPSFALLDGATAGGTAIRWVPLSLALEWAESHPEPPPVADGPTLFARFMSTLTSKNLASPTDVARAPEPSS